MNDTRNALIIDDNVINAELANAHLRRGGWQTRVVGSGIEGIGALDDAAYDLVLLDISMPGMSGIDVCRAIRARPDCRQPRVVAYTAHAMASERQALRDAGFDDILIKPVDRRTMAGMLERMGFAAAPGIGARA